MVVGLEWGWGGGTGLAALWGPLHACCWRQAAPETVDCLALGREEIASCNDPPPQERNNPTIMHRLLNNTSLPLPACDCCREEIASYNDPTIMHKLQMQLAIAEERFEDATA